MLVFLKPAESLAQIILVMKLEACPLSLIESHTPFPSAAELPFPQPMACWKAMFF